MKKLSEFTPAEQEEMKADARSLLHSPAVGHVLAELQDEYLQQLIQAEVGGLTATQAHASMKVLAGFQSRLLALVNSGQPLKPRGRT